MEIILSLLCLPAPQDLSKLVETLGSDRIEERDGATAVLRGLAEEAETHLEEAARRSDPEIALRSREILSTLEPYRREVAGTVVHLLDHAFHAFADQDFARCERVCGAVLAIDPGYRLARELRAAAAEAAGDGGDYDSVVARYERWRWSDPCERQVAAMRQIRSPRRADWESLCRSVVDAVHPPDPDDGCLLGCIVRKLDCMLMDLAFENSKLEDILCFVRDFTGLNILVDARVRDKVDLDTPITLKVKGLPVKRGLELLLGPFGMEIRVTEEGLVLVTMAATAP